MPTTTLPAPPPLALPTSPGPRRRRLPLRLARPVDRLAGEARELFELLDVRLADQPRLRVAIATLRRLGSTATHSIERSPDHSEFRQARAFSGAPQPHPGAKRVLVMSFRGWTSHVAYEFLLGHALRDRGAAPFYLVCGGGLPLTELGRPRAEFPHPCMECRSYVVGFLDAAGFPYAVLDALVPLDEREKIALEVRGAANIHAYVIDGVRPAEHVVRSTLWAARSGLATRDLDSRDEFREFVESAAIVARACTRLLDRERPEAIVMMSGLFFAESVVADIARRRGLSVVTYDFPGRPGTVFVSGGSSATFYEIDDLWATRGKRAPTAEERARVDEDVRARFSGSKALWAGFDFKASPPPTEDGRVRLALFTNVSWDTAVTLRDVGFRDMYQWLEDVIAWAIPRTDVLLDVRVHPGETRVRGFESSDLAAEYIAKRFPELPEHVVIHAPQSTVDSYALIRHASAVLVYTSTIGLEAALIGKPVLVAADVHYRGKGFTIDVADSADLRESLEHRDDLRLTPEQHDLAITYGYLFFHEAMIELRSMSEKWRGKPVLEAIEAAGLRNDPSIERVCDLALAESREVVA